MIFLLINFLACSTDVSIMKRNDDNDSSIIDVDHDVMDSSDGNTEDSFDSTEDIIEGTGGYFEYGLRQIACPPCFNMTQEIEVAASLELHEPITDSHTGWLPDPGVCTETLIETDPSANTIDGGSLITISSPYRDFYLNKSSDGTYVNDNLYESMYDRDVSHSITSDTMGNLTNFISIHGFDSIEPHTMLYVDPSYAFAAPINSSGQYFNWTPNGSDGLFFITIDVYSFDGANYLGSVTCAGYDSGSMLIPSNYLLGYPAGALTAIFITRRSIVLEPMPLIGSFLETHMHWTVVGTGYIQ